MTIARGRLVDPSVTRWYHCVTRCVRRAFLLGEGIKTARHGSKIRLEELAEIFAVAVGGFSVMDNHLHRAVAARPRRRSRLVGRRSRAGGGGGSFRLATSRASRCR